jgi:hypothetical protein
LEEVSMAMMWANLKRCIAAERSGASKYADG